MKKTSCPDFENLLDYFQQLLPTEDALIIQHHLASCLHCQQELVQVQILLADLRVDAAIVVPAQAHHQAVALYRSLKPKVTALSGWRKLLANLVFDTGLEVSSAGLRAETSVTPSRNLRQLLYSVENGEIEIDLQLHTTTPPGHFDVIGQVLGSNSYERRVELIRQGQSKILETLADAESFTFRFQDLPGGVYQLKLYCDEDVIEVSSISL